MEIAFDRHPARQCDLNELFGEKDVFLSIFNPLYFIEVLEEEGRALLEGYLPAVSHEEVLARLNSHVREAMEELPILSPEGFMKNEREELNFLTESLVKLRAQKALLVQQQENRMDVLEKDDTTMRTLNTEIAELEEKRDKGIDYASLRAELAESSSRYEDMAKEPPEPAQTEELDNQLAGCRKVLHQLEGKQYQSPYEQELARQNTELQALAAQYQRDKGTLDKVKPNTCCPFCRTKITADNVETVKSGLCEVIRQEYSQGVVRKKKLADLRELDKKAQDTFREFRSRDIEKAQDAINFLEQKRSELIKNVGEAAKQRSACLDELNQKIQALGMSIECGNLDSTESAHLSGMTEQRKLLTERIATLESVNTQKPEDFDAKILNTAAQITQKKVRMSNAVLYIAARSEITLENLKLNKVKITLADLIKTTGEMKNAFRFTYEGRPYKWLSLSESVRAGLEVSEMVKRLTGRNYPVFIDNSESVPAIDNVKPSGQIFLSRVVKGQSLEVKPAGTKVPTAQPAKAA